MKEFIYSFPNYSIRMSDQAFLFRNNLITHNQKVGSIEKNTPVKKKNRSIKSKLTIKDYKNIGSKKVTCDMCKKLFSYKELTRVTNIGMICNNCYFK